VSRVTAAVVTGLLITAHFSSNASADCWSCVQAKVPGNDENNEPPTDPEAPRPEIHPFFGIDTVEVYLDPDAQAANDSAKALGISVPFDSRRVKMAMEQWASKCSGLPGIPTFVPNFEKVIKDPKKRDERASILIDYQPEFSSQSSGSHAERFAIAAGTHITLFGHCDSLVSACNAQSVFQWGSDHGQQLIAHELGHTLGLFHDKGCNKAGLMTGSAWGDQTFPLMDEYCQMASAINDPQKICGLNGQASGGKIHPCQQCQYKLGGNVMGLEPGVTVELELSLSGLQQPYYQSIYAAKNEYSFDEKVPDGFGFRSAPRSATTTTPAPSRMRAERCREQTSVTWTSPANVPRANLLSRRGRARRRRTPRVVRLTEATFTTPTNGPSRLPTSVRSSHRSAGIH
jgi:hypothetical protein